MIPPRAAVKYPGVLGYLLASTLHWHEREQALRRVLARVDAAEAGSAPALRIVDVGCGPGLLLPVAADLGYHYLGIDSDPNHIAYCRERFSGMATGEFVCGSADALDGEFGPHDVMVLNG